MKISIIIPLYNASKTINKCMDSIINQTYNNFEVIIINDGSKDDSLLKLKKYLNDKRIILVNQENRGQGATRNRGISMASGEYIMFIDADDYISNDYLNRMVKLGETTKAEVVVSGFTNISSDYKILNKVIFKKENIDWIKFSFIVPWGKLIKRSLLKDNKIEFAPVIMGEDIVFSLVLASYASKYVVDESNVGYNYYYNTSSLTKSAFKSFKHSIIPSNEALLQQVNKKYYELHEKEFWYFFIKNNIYYLLFSGKNSTPAEFVAKDNEIFKWLEKNNDLYKTERLVSLFYPASEKFNVRFIVWVYMILRKLKLIKLFARLYCKNYK